MGEYAEMELEGFPGSYYTGERPPKQIRKSFGCPKCAHQLPDQNARRKHLRDAHGLKMVDGGKLRPIHPPTPARKATSTPEGGQS